MATTTLNVWDVDKLPSLAVTVIVAVPIAFPVTVNVLPEMETVAILLLLDDVVYVKGLPSASLK